MEFFGDPRTNLSARYRKRLREKGYEDLAEAIKRGIEAEKTIAKETSFPVALMREGYALAFPFVNLPAPDLLPKHLLDAWREADKGRKALRALKKLYAEALAEVGQVPQERLKELAEKAIEAFLRTGQENLAPEALEWLTHQENLRQEGEKGEATPE